MTLIQGAIDNFTWLGRKGVPTFINRMHAGINPDQAAQLAVPLKPVEQILAGSRAAALFFGPAATGFSVASALGNHTHHMMDMAGNTFDIYRTSGPGLIGQGASIVFGLPVGYHFRNLAEATERWGAKQIERAATATQKGLYQFFKINQPPLKETAAHLAEASLPAVTTPALAAVG